MTNIKRRTPEQHTLPDDLHPLLRRIYAARNVTDPTQLDMSLQSLPGHDQLKGMAQAAKRIADAIEAGDKILVVGDFDADGATSCAVAVRGLRALGAGQVDFLVPNRFEFGYGLTPAIVGLAAKYSPDLIITVDNGIASINGVNAANDAGIPVVVTDHHLPGDQLPDAAAIVNPNQPGCSFPGKSLAGVGVLFYVLLGVRHELRTRGCFDASAQPNLAMLLDLVALGTVADVVPLDRINRVLVSQGLARIRAGQCCPGIHSLALIAGRPMHRLNTSDLGFFLGPRLNAAGRIDDMSLGIRCLLTDSAAEARQLAETLDKLNLERRQIQQSMQDDADKALKECTDGYEHRKSICLYQPHWHQGVVGLVASRLKERFHRPVIAFAPGDSGELKGSGRSIEGFHIRDALDRVATRYPGLLHKFGGHAMAAGLSLDVKHLESFVDAFEETAGVLLDADSLVGSMYTDGELEPEHFNLEVAELLARSGPWGQGFPEPAFEGEFSVTSKRLVGDNHLKLVLQPIKGGVDIEAIAFGMAPDGVVPDLRRVYAVFRLEVNDFRNRIVAQLRIEHLEPAPSSFGPTVEIP
ncbi:MAG: single-stranded-DNA-specific exonuclease RecJ [Gammaproteobacteria bacterium]|nr:single-stranded-DNA-specific exonuclease RecJ [Gammaproteobacteria bacterium]